MALLFDRVASAQLVERPHGLAAEGAWNAESTLPCAILVLSLVLVMVSFVRRRLEMGIMKKPAVAKHQHRRTSCSPSAFHLLCQSFDALHVTPKDESVPSSRSMTARSARLRGRSRRGLSQTQGAPSCEITLQAEQVRASEPAPPAPCCEVVPQAEKVQVGESAEEVVRAGKVAALAPCYEVALRAVEVVRAGNTVEETVWATKTAPFAPCCEVPLQAEEVVQADETAEEVVRAGAMVEEDVRAGDPGEEVAWVIKPAEEVMWASKPALPVPSSEEVPLPSSKKLRSATDDSASVAADSSVATDARGTSIGAPPGLSSCRNIDVSMGPPPLGGVVEGTTVSEANVVAVGGGLQTICALKSTLQGNDHASSGPVGVSSSAWGCSVQRVYSNALFLAHRSVYLKISKGAPGLQRIEEPSPASARRAPWSEMPDLAPANEVAGKGAHYSGCASAATRRLNPRE